MRLILKVWIYMANKTKQFEKEQGSRKGGSDSEPSRGRLQLKQANRVFGCLKVPICRHFSSEVNEAYFSTSIEPSRRKGAARWCFQTTDVPFWDVKGAAALLVVAVAFTRLHDYSACCDDRLLCSAKLH